MTKERKLLQREVNRKLFLFTNRTSKERDFINSPQILTQRQEIYLSISRNLRRKDNRKQLRKLPFPVDKTALPHINISKTKRLVSTANEILEDKKQLQQVINAHSFRTATPYYTNPNWTIDNGKVQNYSQHIGVLLHTPRYIEYLKNIKSVKSQKSQDQHPSNSEKPSSITKISKSNSLSSTEERSFVYTNSCASSSRKSSLKENKSNSRLSGSKNESYAREASVTNSKEEYSSDFSESKKDKIDNCEGSVELADNNNNNKNENVIEKEENYEYSNDFSVSEVKESENTSLEQVKTENFKTVEIDDKKTGERSFCDNMEDQNSNKSQEDLTLKINTEENDLEKCDDISNKENKDIVDFDEGPSNKSVKYEMTSSELTKPQETSVQATYGDEFKLQDESETQNKDDFFDRETSDDENNASKNELLNEETLHDDNKIPIDNTAEKDDKDDTLISMKFLEETKEFLSFKQPNFEDSKLITRYFESFSKYFQEKPSYTKDLGEFYEKYNSANFIEFCTITRKYSDYKISVEYLNEIKAVLDNYLMELEVIRNRGIAQSNSTDKENGVTESNEEENVVIDGSSSKDNDEGNVTPSKNSYLNDTLNRIFGEDLFEDNVVVEVNEISDEDEVTVNDVDNKNISKSFEVLFRKSFDFMNENHIKALQEMVERQEKMSLDHNDDLQYNGDVFYENDEVLKPFGQLLHNKTLTKSDSSIINGIIAEYNLSVDLK